MQKSLIISIALMSAFINIAFAGVLNIPPLNSNTRSSILEAFNRSLRSPQFVDLYIGKNIESESVDVGPILPVFSLDLISFTSSSEKKSKLSEYLSFRGYYMGVVLSARKAVYLMDFKVVKGVFKYVGGMGSGDWTDAILAFEKKRKQADTKHAFVMSAYPIVKLVRITDDDQIEIYSMNPPGHDSSNTIQGLKEYLKFYFRLSNDQ
jgi:hypothetical protein